MTVDAVLERMRQAYGEKDLAGVAARLKMEETTFRVWASRKKVPAKVLVAVSQQTGRSVSWLGEAQLTSEDLTLREPEHVFFAGKEKQVNPENVITLSAEEHALLANFRAASTEGRLAIAAASAALAQPKSRLKGRRAA